MYATNYFEGQVLNVLRDTSLPGYGNLYIGLYLTNPGETGIEGIELSYPEYARMPITFTAPSAESGGMGTRNEESILWEVASQDAGQVRFIGISDSPVVGGGNMLLYGELTAPLEVRAGQQPSIYKGDVLYFLLGDASVWFKTQVLNLLRGKSVEGFTPHLALFDGDPEGTGAELAGASYARPEIVFGTPSVQSGGQTQMENPNLVRFPAPTETWGNWAWDGLMTAPINGELVFKTQNAIPEILQRNYVPQVPAGEYKVEVN